MPFLNGVRWPRATPILLGLLVLVGSTLPGPALADEPPVSDGIQRLGLEQCIATALQNQPIIAAQQSAVGAAEGLEAIARSTFFPQASANVAFAELNDPLKVTIQNPINGQARDLLTDSAAFFGIARKAGVPTALALLNTPTAPPFVAAKQAASAAFPSAYQSQLLGQSTLTTQVSVLQPVYTGGKIRSKFEQAKLGVHAAHADVTKSRQETIYGVTTAYQGVLLVEALIQVAADTAGQYRAIESLARNLREQDSEFITEADERRAGSLKRMAEAEQVKYQRAREVAYAALQQSMGTGESLRFLIADTRLTPQGTPPELAAILNQAIKSRPELLKARIGTKVADLETDFAAAQFRPDIAIFARSFSLNSSLNAISPNSIVSVGVAVDIPLFAGGKRIAQVRRSQSQLAQAVKIREYAESLVVLEVKKVFQDYLEQAEKLPLLDSAVEDARKAIRSYQAQFASDSIEEKDMPKYFENLLISRLLLTQALGQYYQAAYGYNNAMARLRLVAGAP